MNVTKDLLITLLQIEFNVFETEEFLEVFL